MLSFLLVLISCSPVAVVSFISYPVCQFRWRSTTQRRSALHPSFMASRFTVAITGGNGFVGTKLARYWLGTRFQLQNAASASSAGTTPSSTKGRGRLPVHIKLLDDYEGFLKDRPVQCPRESVDPTWPGFPAVDPEHSFERIPADLLDPVGSWRDALEDVDTVVHLAAVNPYLDCNWQESMQSMRMTSNIISACQQLGVRRFVFASSNHVLGNYFRQGAILDAPQAPALDSTTPPVPDKFQTGPTDEAVDATAYSVAKVAGEVMAETAAATSPGTSAISVRIGWCQPGENHPRTMTAGGSPANVVEDGAEGDYPDPTVLGYDCPANLLRWFQQMWLSNRDLGQLMTKCVEYEYDEDDETNYMVVNGMSANTGRRWSRENYTRYCCLERDMLFCRPTANNHACDVCAVRALRPHRLGFEPQDDVTLHVKGYDNSDGKTEDT